MEQETKPEELAPQSQGPQCFRKKPLEVLAVQVAPENKEALARFLGEEEWAFTDEGVLFRCDESVVLAKWWDWVIKDEECEPYPCRASIFEKTYEPI